MPDALEELDGHWKRLGRSLHPEDFTDDDVEAAPSILVGN
jgi:hypothetical protein